MKTLFKSIIITTVSIAIGIAAGYISVKTGITDYYSIIFLLLGWFFLIVPNYANEIATNEDEKISPEAIQDFCYLATAFCIASLYVASCSANIGMTLKIFNVVSSIIAIFCCI